MATSFFAHLRLRYLPFCDVPPFTSPRTVPLPVVRVIIPCHATPVWFMPLWRGIIHPRQNHYSYCYCWRVSFYGLPHRCLTTVLVAAPVAVATHVYGFTWLLQLTPPRCVTTAVPVELRSPSCRAPAHTVHTITCSYYSDLPFATLRSIACVHYYWIER